MPIIVIHKNSPITRASRARNSPLITSHNIFARKEAVPPPYLISFPKGKKAREASLKHCNPIGRPIMVILQMHPATTHEIPIHIPPRQNHSAFPKHPKEKAPFHFNNIFPSRIPAFYFTNRSNSFTCSVLLDTL